MKVHEIMYRLLSCDPSTPLHQAVDMMVNRKRASIIVVAKDGKPIGMFTERDALRLLSSRKDLKDLKMEDVMVMPRFFVNEDESINEAQRILEENNIRKLPVLNSKGEAVGMVTSNLIAKNMRYMMARGMVTRTGGTLTT